MSITSARPHALRMITVAAILGALTVLGATAALAAPRYPASVRHAFVTACTKTAVSVSSGAVTKTKAKTYCSRALTCINKKLTLKQFATVVRNMQTGAKNPNAKVLLKCEASAKKSVGR